MGLDRHVEVIVEGGQEGAQLVDLVRRTARIALRQPRRVVVDGPGVPERSLGVTVLLTGDDTLQDLNRQFAGEDKVTDVLAFGSGTAFPGDEGDAGNLGDIAISMPQARRQAASAGHSEERETAMLTAHGVLHLLGYDHAEPDEEREMTGITNAILEEAFQLPYRHDLPRRRLNSRRTVYK